MALERIKLELAIPKAEFDALPLAKKIAFRDAVRWAKAHAVKINEGRANEEDTTIALRQTCRHDEGKECDPWLEI